MCVSLRQGNCDVVRLFPCTNNKKERRENAIREEVCKKRNEDADIVKGVTGVDQREAAAIDRW